MPLTERGKLFSIIARQGFEKKHYIHDEVLGDIRQSFFTIKEAAEYLEVAKITVRRWVRDSILKHKSAFSLILLADFQGYIFSNPA